MENTQESTFLLPSLAYIPRIFGGYSWSFIGRRCHLQIRPISARIHQSQGLRPACCHPRSCRGRAFLGRICSRKTDFYSNFRIPQNVIDAFTSAEDQNFYHHKGVDITAIARAVVMNIKNRGQGKRPVGASTITQQVAKNFLLTNEVSYERKIREAILAYKLEQSFSKDRILELYLNQIFLGQRSYGVAAAALHYFNKPLNELNIAEVSFLAALPKAPNNYNPETKHEAALLRRNWVIDRMKEDGHITAEQANEAVSMPLVTMPQKDDDVVNAPYFAEEVRRELKEKYGDDELYRGGLSVRTSLDPKLQKIAETALQNGLMAYDIKHGWRGAINRASDIVDFAQPSKTHPSLSACCLLGNWVWH